MFIGGAPGIWELLIILGIVVVIFGAGKLPQIGSGLGKAISNFKSGVKPDKVEGNQEAKKEKIEEKADSTKT